MNRAYNYGKRSWSCINTTTIEMQALCIRAMRIANRQKLHCPDWGVTSGHRTEKTQQSLYAIGRTVNPHMRTVTNADGVNNKSVHQSGDAVDIVSMSGRDNGYNPGDLALIACCFFLAASELNIRLRWGGNFRSISDGAHLEIVR